MTRYADHVNRRKTPQNVRTPGRKDEVKNNAGGFVFAVTEWEQFKRFLILGAAGGTYYVGERELTIENAEAAQNCIAANGPVALGLITQISEGGRAPKNEPALFALALATVADSKETRKMAWNLLPRIARTGTHLFTFIEYREKLGGWGRLARNGVGAWYTSKNVGDLAYQVLKYVQRDGWSHRDVLRLCHVTGSPEQNAIFNAITKPEKLDIDHYDQLPRLFSGVLAAKSADTAEMCAHIVTDYKLSREMVPTQFLNEPEVQAALFEHMPITAMIRNLGNLTKSGLIKPMSKHTKEAVSRLTDAERLRKGRVHPLAILTALRTYSSGHGMRGKGSWSPVGQIVDALDKALELSFGTVEPTGKRIVYGLDVSGSMGSAAFEGISCAECAAVLALVSAKIEPNYFIGGFATEFRDLKISARDSFSEALRKTRGLNFGGTDCAVPMTYALKHEIEADAFVVITDNESWAGPVKPYQALQDYRQKMGIPAKSVAVAMTATRFSIADPNDAGMLDVVGMDTSVPNVIAEFLRQ